MARVDLADLRTVRRALGKSQAEFAELLGTSARAIESYEQGWRPVPPHVQKLSGLLLFAKWQAENGKPAPCWKVRNCTRDVRTECSAWQLKAGDLCWLLGGTKCNGESQDGWISKLAMCRKCKVMAPWLSY